MKLISQPFGATLAIGICGSAEEIRTMTNRLFNWGATSSEPHYISETFAYVLSSEEKMVNFFANTRSNRLRKEGTKDERKIVHTWKQSCAMAQADFARRITPENFLPKNEVGEFNHAIGNTDFDGLDS